MTKSRHDSHFVSCVRDESSFESNFTCEQKNKSQFTFSTCASALQPQAFQGARESWQSGAAPLLQPSTAGHAGTLKNRRARRTCLGTVMTRDSKRAQMHKKRRWCWWWWWVERERVGGGGGHQQNKESKDLMNADMRCFTSRLHTECTMRTHNVLISCVRDAKDNEHQCYKNMRCHCVHTRMKEEVKREQMTKKQMLSHLSNIAIHRNVSERRAASREKRSF
jgi:hypothetical protein